MRKKWVWILPAVVVLGGARGAFVASRRGPSPTPVQLAEVEREDLQAKVAANGKIQAQKKVEISATIMGQITQLAVREGDAVKKGQFLLEIDPANPRAVARSSEASMQALLRDVESAQANLALAKSDFERARANFEAKIIPRADYERAETGVTTSEAMLRSAERRVEQARAPARRGARHAVQDRGPLADRRDRHRAPGRGGRGRRHRDPEQPRHRAADDLRHVGRRDRDGGRRGLDPAGRSWARRSSCGSTPTRTAPSDGVVTEVGSSPILQSSAHRPGDQVQGQGPDQGPAGGDQARADRAGRHPDRLRPAGPGGPDPVDRAAREGAAGRDAAAGRRGARGGGRLRGRGARKKGRSPSSPIKTGLMGELSIEVKEGLKGGREGRLRAVQGALRTLKPGDPVRQGEGAAEGGGRAGGATEDLTMDFGDLIREALDAIRSHALRSFLTLLGIIIGVATIVGVVSVIAGLDQYVQERIIILSPDVYVVDQVRHHPRARRVPRGAQAARTSRSHDVAPAAGHADPRDGDRDPGRRRTGRGEVPGQAPGRRPGHAGPRPTSRR